MEHDEKGQNSNTEEQKHGQQNEDERHCNQNARKSNRMSEFTRISTNQTIHNLSSDGYGDIRPHSYPQHKDKLSKQCL